MKKFAVMLVAIVVVAVASYLTLKGYESEEIKIVPFSSEDEFREYITSHASGYAAGIYPIEYSAVKSPQITSVTIDREKGVTGDVVRYSQTNVQVEGIDEPDIVKTDGSNLYISRMINIYLPEYEPRGGISIVSAFPPENMSVKTEISDYGQLLLYKNALIVLRFSEIKAYNTETGKKLWEAEMNGSLVGARLYNGKIFVVIRDNVIYPSPCPIRPVEINGKAYTISCTGIYHPTVPTEVDSTYTILAIDPLSGKIEKHTSFVGSTGSSVVYMSKNAIYVTYNSFTDPAKLAYMFVKENPDLFPDWVVNKIERLMDYDISNRAKSVEISVIMDQYLASLSKEERLKVENEYWNRWTEFRERHAREIELTYIAKFGLDLKLESFGKVPGRLLNQFSLDEYEGYLRVATTVGGEENDLYILDSNLDVVGSIQGFGLDERIYSVRFIGEKGYIVTFRQTDPFFIVDLSDPKRPKITGELKIPGFSSYLHPISDTLILGVGKEGNWVKISLFDVSDPENPKEVDRYTLKEYWSDVLNTHHAFLLDKKHEIFFLPAGNGGYIFSYSGGIKLVKAVSGKAVRAVYINDYLYIIGANRIVAYDEKSWEKVGELNLT